MRMLAFWALKLTAPRQKRIPVKLAILLIFTSPLFRTGESVKPSRPRDNIAQTKYAMRVFLRWPVK